MLWRLQLLLQAIASCPTAVEQNSSEQPRAAFPATIRAFFCRSDSFVNVELFGAEARDSRLSLETFLLYAARVESCGLWLTPLYIVPA